MFRFAKIAACIFLATLVPCARGDGASSAIPNSLSLAAAKRIAFQRNWDLLAAQANVDLAVAQKIVSHEWPNPTFSYSTAKITLDNNPSSTRLGNDVWNRSYDTIFAVNQLYEIGGKRSSRQAASAAGLKAAEESFRDARRTLDLGVSKAYIAVVAADASVNVLRQSAASGRHEADIAGARFKAGDIRSSDKLQLEIQASQFELNAKAAEANAIAARIELEILLGEKNATGRLQPTDSLEKLAEFSPGQGNPALRPDLLAALSNVRQAEANLRLQKAMRIPDPTWLVEYEHNPPDTPTTAGFGVSFPLPLWNWNRGNIKAAESSLRTAILQAGKVEGLVSSDIGSAFTAYIEATGRMHRYQDEIKPKSAKVLETISFAYKKGGASLVDLLQAERTDNDVRTATEQAMSDRATAAAALAAARNANTETEPSKKSNGTKKSQK
jgi:cobalt-zinc-cadmium efflux system outer membrane protein